MLSCSRSTRFREKLFRGWYHIEIVFDVPIIRNTFVFTSRNYRTPLNTTFDCIQLQRTYSLDQFAFDAHVINVLYLIMYCVVPQSTHISPANLFTRYVQQLWLSNLYISMPVSSTSGFSRKGGISFTNFGFPNLLFA